MSANFGKSGAYYYWISRGVDERPVCADRIRKSVGAENTFSTDLAEFEPMVAELRPLVDKVWRHCEATGNRGRTVTLKVKFFDFEIITAQQVGPLAGLRPRRSRAARGRPTAGRDAVAEGRAVAWGLAVVPADRGPGRTSARPADLTPHI